jgi:hypothetical protein
MSAPILFLLACLDCVQQDLNPLQPAPSNCAKQQSPRLQGTESTTCVSPPEAIVASGSADIKLADIKLANTNRNSINHASSIALKPTPPETLPSAEWAGTTAHPAGQPLLRSGSQGQAVSRLQTRLNQLGHRAGAVDGFYGQQTQAAVMQFQRSRGLQVDGVVGDKTWAMLFAPSRSPQPAQPPQSTHNTLHPDAVQNTPSPVPDSSPQHSTAILRIPAAADLLSPLLDYWWALGWVIIYAGGWVFIIKDGVKELGGFRYATAPVRRKNFDAAIQRTASSHPQMNHPAAIAQPAVQLATSDAMTIVDAAPALQSNHEPSENLQVAIADDGKVQPIQNVFVNLNGPTKTPNNRTRTSTDKKHQSASAIAAAPIKSVTSINPDDETVIATLSTMQEKSEALFSYMLLNDTENLFVMRGNELRVVMSRLEQYRSIPSKVITIRRTDSNGAVVDRSFKLEVQKLYSRLKAS